MYVLYFPVRLNDKFKLRFVETEMESLSNYQQSDHDTFQGAKAPLDLN